MLGLNRLSIQSKLILLLLTVTLGSIATVAWIGYQSASQALKDAAYNQLQGVRVAKTDALKAMLEAIRDQAISFSDSQACLTGMVALKAAHRELQGTAKLEPAQQKALEDFYAKTFIPGLDKMVEGTPQVSQYLPTNPVETYLQYHYIAANPGQYMKKQEMEIAPGDKSSYGTAHQKFHKMFARAATLFGFEDVMLIDSDTLDVIYTFQKSTDFATNLETGAYASSNLAEAVRKIRKTRDKDDFKAVDFEPYRPNWGAPMGFVASPIFDGPRMIGILALQFPINNFNRITTANYNWKAEGLGDTGECYLVGPDKTMRSRSRFMYTDPKGFVADMRRRGVPRAAVDQIERQGNVINAMPVNTTSAEKALQGQNGIEVTTDYRGQEVLSAYGHLDLNSLRWGVITEIDTEEAFRPVRDFGRKVLITGVGMALLTSLLALVASNYLVRPLKQLEEGARRLGSGETDVKVRVKSKDEFGQLAHVFNEMAENLNRQKNELEEKGRENLELLLNILPASAVAQRMEGDQKATKQFADVTVVFAEFSGLEELDKSLGERKSLSLLSDLVAACDEAAERAGVEKVRTVGASYLGVCGLSISRPDHSARVIQFARDLVRLIDNFNRDHKTALTLAIGINSGPVVGGVVGRQKFLYDLWGDTVTIASRLASGQSNVVLVTKPVHDRLGDLHPFGPRQEIEVRGKGMVQFWRLEVG
ncbi:MAG: adenylate/guanylate cyclase domain-containing protein [Gemmataceae bacterium]